MVLPIFPEEHLIRNGRILGAQTTAAALFILPAALELVQSMPGSAAWERTADGSFDRIYGSDLLHAETAAPFVRCLLAPGLPRTKVSLETR